MSKFEAVLFDLNGVLIDFGLSDPDESMLKLVKRLRSNSIKTAIISNLTASGGAAVRAQAWSQNFDALVFSGEAGFSKPDPRIFTITAQKLEVAAQACVFVDDDEYRLSGAHEIGMTTHLFTGQQALEQELQMLGLVS